MYTTDYYFKGSNNQRYDNQRRRAHFNKNGNLACNSKENNSDQKIYASMALISSNDECPSRNFGDNLQVNYLILDYGATCHMTPEVSDYIPGLLEDTINTLKLQTHITS